MESKLTKPPRRVKHIYFASSTHSRHAAELSGMATGAFDGAVNDKTPLVDTKFLIG